MKTLSKLLALCAIVLVALVLVASVSDNSNVYATKDMYKIAKDKFGKDIKGCKHCHVKPLPKEDDHELNEVGQWLVKQKEERGAEMVDPAWLAEYPGSN